MSSFDSLCAAQELANRLKKRAVKTSQEDISVVNESKFESKSEAIKEESTKADHVAAEPVRE